jgi:hypothetical protein
MAQIQPTRRLAMVQQTPQLQHTEDNSSLDIFYNTYEQSVFLL